MQLVLDMETFDPYIEEGLGSGWPFYKEGRLSILFAAYKIDNNQEEVTEDMSLLLDIVSNASTIICHNVNYDIGLLHALGADYNNARVIDTIQLAKFNNNTLFNYSLDALSSSYFNDTKTSSELGELAQRLGLVKTKAQNPVKVAMNNLDVLYKADPNLLHTYAKKDVALTYKLFNKLISPDFDIDFYSDLNKALIQARSEGVRVDRHRAEVIKEKFEANLLELEYVLEDMAPGVNVNSTKQLAAYFDANGVEYHRNENGNPSITKDFLESCPHPLARTINKYKKYEKAVRDFIDPILEGKRDRVYPEIKIFGAAATGRMSCANPNLQQIPKRDEEIGPLVRSIYLPEKGEQWYSLDFSSQEPRMQIHFAGKIGAPGIGNLIDAFKENHAYDLHKKTASLMFNVSEANVTKDQRNQAKTINLGLAYGMGVKKLADSLGLPLPHAQNLLKMYHCQVPFMKFMSEICSRALNSRGYIKTIEGRKLLNDGFRHKALNKLIQGSSADQTNRALVELYRAGIKFKFPIHDSIEISAKDTIIILKAKEIMETSTPLLVPSLSEVEVGDNWGSLRKVEI